MVPKTCSIPECEKYSRARGWCEAHYARWRRHGSPIVNMRPELAMAPEERFWSNVDRTGQADCWEWQASTVAGYGQARLGNGRSKTLVHRFSYELANGPISDGALIDHICRNRKCVNPAHLRQVTRKQNAENVSGPNASGTSGYLGVSWNKKREAWEASVGHNGKANFCGFYADRKEAAEAARRKRVELFTHNELDR